MTKTCKKILISVFLTLCLVISMFAIVACKPNAEEAVTYTVAVQKEDESPVKGVKVQIRQGGTTYELKTTDSDGVATFELVPDDYEVVLSNLPDHFSIAEGTSLTFSKDNRDLTVTLKQNFAYTVRLVNPDQTPYRYYEGVSVIICTIPASEDEVGNCLTAVPVDENGVAVIEGEPDNYHAQVTGLPSNATYSKDFEGYYMDDTLTPTKTEMSIVIYTATVLDLSSTSTAKMSGEEKSAYAASNPSYSADLQKFDAFKFSEEIAGGKTAYFAVTPSMSGVYHYFTNASTEGDSTNKGFTLSTTEAGGHFSNDPVYTQGQTYVFLARNNSTAAATFEFVVTVPLSSYVTYKGNGGAVSKYLELTVGSNDTNAIISFTPTKAGIYTLTLSSAEFISITDASHYEPSEFCTPSTSATDEVVIEFLADTAAVNGEFPYFFAVSVNASAGSFPVAVDVYIQRTGEVNDVTNDVPVTETLTKQTKPEDKQLHGLPMENGSKDLLEYNENDKAYHYKPNGSEDAGIVYVKLTSAVEKSRFGESSALAYMDKNPLFPVKYAYTVENTDGNGSVTTDYKLFLRGFKNYNRTPNMSGGYTYTIPTTLTQENCYTNNVNEDGAYPLTKELMAFLKEFYSQNEALLSQYLPEAVQESDSAWLFPCYYYGEVVDVDKIVGEYKFVAKTEYGETSKVGDEKAEWEGGGYVTADDYKLVVEEDGTFIIYKLYDSYDPEVEGTWTNVDGTYTFTVVTWETVTYTVDFNSATGTIKLTRVEEDPEAEENSWEFTLAAND